MDNLFLFVKVATIIILVVMQDLQNDDLLEHVAVYLAIVILCNAIIILIYSVAIEVVRVNKENNYAIERKIYELDLGNCNCIDQMGNRNLPNCVLVDIRSMR